MKIWGLSFLVPLIFLCQFLSGQNTFNLGHLIELNTGFESVYQLADSTFIVTGWTGDSLTPGQVNFTLTHFSSNGLVLDENVFPEPTSAISSRINCKSEIHNFYVQPKQIIVDTTYAHRLIWFNGQLDTLRSQIVYSAYVDSTWLDDDFMLPRTCVIDKDSCTFFSFGIWNIESTGNDNCVKKISPSGEELWTYIYATDSNFDSVFAMESTNDGGVIIGITSGEVLDGVPKIKFIRLDEFGQETWEISGFGISARIIYDFITDEQSIVFAGSCIHDNDLIHKFRALIAKTDLSGNILWHQLHGDESETIPRSFTNIVQTCDGNYIASGAWKSVPGSEEIIEGQNNEDYDEFVYLTKYHSVTGDLIWERQYRFFEVYNDQHFLVDMKATLDGGIIFSGEARDLYTESEDPPQKGWLVKLDACGCLVPGCDPDCSTETCPDPENPISFTPESNFIVGPNPSVDYINIHFLGTQLNLENLFFELYDMQGKIVFGFKPNSPETTYVYSTEGIAAGTYILKLMDENKHLEEKKILILD